MQNLMELQQNSQILAKIKLKSHQQTELQKIKTKKFREFNKIYTKEMPTSRDSASQAQSANRNHKNFLK